MQIRDIVFVGFLYLSKITFPIANPITNVTITTRKKGKIHRLHLQPLVLCQELFRWKTKQHHQIRR